MRLELVVLLAVMALSMTGCSEGEVMMALMPPLWPLYITYKLMDATKSVWDKKEDDK